MNRFLFVYILLFITFGVNTYSNNKYSVGSQRSFESIDFTESDVNVNQFNLADEVEKLVSDAEMAMDSVKNNVLKQKRFVNRLDSATFISLPVGLSYSTDTLSDPNYFIIIDKATIYPQYAEFSAFMSLVNPIDGQIIRFRADNIKFSFKSGLINGFKLDLVSELKTKLNNETYLYWMPGSFVDWDCNGFKSLGISAKVELNENKYVKVDPLSGKEQGKVSATFFVTAAGLNDMVLELSLDPFKKVGFDEAYFSLNKVTLDFSDSYNAPGFKLPSNYPGGYTGEMAKLWKGFYVQEAKIFLSGKFKHKDGTITSLYAQKLFLDDFGLTGEMGVNDLLTYEEGKLGDWGMSVSHFEMSFFTGDFVSMGLNGGVIVKGIDDPMLYDAFYDANGTYHFGIVPGKALSFSVFSAKVTLDSTSRIDVWVEKEEFMPEATLSGDITFACAKKPGEGKTLLNIPNIEFQGLHIATKAPMFDIKYVALVSTRDSSDMGKFPITISEVTFDKRNANKAVFGFTIAVNLAPSDKFAFSGDTHVGIVASINDGDWKYSGLELTKIAVKASIEGAFEIDGSIMFMNGDATYGDGFRGAVHAVIGGTFDVDVVVVFGKVNAYRYFFVDAFCMFNPGIKAGPFNFTGFGGGIFFKVRQAGTDDPPKTDFGKSLSDISYVPDKSMLLGLKFAVKAGIVDPAMVDAKLNFTIFFTNSMGIASIGFDGEANMLKTPKSMSSGAMKTFTSDAAEGEKPKVEPSPMMLKVSMLMDFQNKSFHSEMEMYLNIAGVIKGIGENNRAGWGVLHFDPDKWYMHIGTPTDPIGLNFIGLMQVDSYFMAGYDIPDAMMMDSRVLEILNMDQSDFNGERDEGVLSKGKGLAFGTHFNLDTGDLTFLIFYASFEFGGGFDIMLLDYGPNIYCKGRDGHPGINGWYAKGQAYAYFAGKIGIRVKIFRKTKTFDIINLQAAVAIRVEGPNPTWMKGVVGGKYRILGGMIKGNCKFEANIGDKCEMRGPKDLADLEIIADLTPAKDAEDVDLFTMPQAVFNMPVDKVLTIAEDPELTKTFKINLEEYAVYSEDGSKYPGEIEWNEDKTSLGYRMHEIFYSNSTYKVVAKVSFDEKVNGEWQPYKGDDGKVYYETKEATFKTGAVPTKIRENAIQYSYPIDRMVNFYKEEYNKAYVGFDPGVGAFFENTEGYTQKARWTQVNGEPIYSSLAYNKETRTVEANIPSGLVNEKIYRFDLVHVPISDNTSVDRNIIENVKSAIDEEDGNSTEVTTREAEGVINDGEEIAFYGLDFRCSKYNKFLEKFPLDQYNVTAMKFPSAAVYLPGAAVYSEEMLDKVELNGVGNAEPLVSTKAYLPTANWYQENIAPYLYNTYPYHRDATVTWRDTLGIGLPPVKEITYYQYYKDNVLTQDGIETGVFSDIPTKLTFMYGVPKYWAVDYINIRNKVSNLLVKGEINSSDKINFLLDVYPCPQVSLGIYPIQISYRLPGINKVTSSKVLNINNKDYDYGQVKF